MKKIIFFLAIFLAGFAYNAYSQDNEYNKNRNKIKDTVLNEILVTANVNLPKEKYQIAKLNVPIKDLPVSTNEVSSKLLDIKNITEIREAANFLPGVRVYTSYGAFEQISIRGFGQQVIMIDGVRDERTVHASSSYPFPDLSSVESIELLKGPASVLYGTGTVGGVINIVRKAPVAKQSVSARIGYGSYNVRQSKFGFGGKLAGPVNYRVSLNYSDGSGWRHIGNSRLSGYYALASNIGKNGNLEIRGGFNKDYYGTETGLPSNMESDIYDLNNQLYLSKGEQQPHLNPSLRYNNQSDFMKHNNANISAQYTHNFSDKFRIMDKLSYSYDDINYFGTEELSYLTSKDPIYKHYYMRGNKKTYICLDSVALTYPLRFSHIAQTVNNQLDFAGRLTTGKIIHNYIAGYSLVALYRNSFSGYNLGVDVKGPGLYSHVSVRDPHSAGYMTSSFSKVTPQRRFMHGIYAQDLIEFSNKIKVLVAGRYDYFQYQSCWGVKTIDGKRKFDMPLEKDFSKVKTSSFSYRTGIVYEPFAPLQLFTSIGSFFKANTTYYSDKYIYVNTHGKEFTAENGDEVFKPESGYQIEAGAKYRFNERLEGGVNFFYIRKRNIVSTLRNKGEILDDGTVLDKAVRGQFGRMDSRGFDFDITYRPMDNMLLGTGYSYTNARTRGNKDNKYLTANATKGQQFSHIPENTFYFYGNYTFINSLLKGLTANISVNYMDNVYYSISSKLKTPAYWTTDLSLAYNFKRYYTMSFIINNLFDARYFTEPSVAWQLIPGMPRNYQVSVSFNF